MGLKRERAEAVIQDMHEMTLTKALKKHGVGTRNFFGLLKQVPSLEEAYALAQEARAEILADEIVDIADDSTAYDAQKARNQIDVRKWAASKMRPQKYGERIDVNLNQTVDIRGALEESKARVRQVLEIPKIQLVETTSSIVETTGGLKPPETGSTVKNELDDLLD